MKKKITFKTKPIEISQLEWIMKNDSPTMLKDLRDAIENVKRKKKS